MKIRNEKVIDVSEWDELVKRTYGRMYSFQQQGGCQDRGSFRLTVPDQANDYEENSVPEVVNGEEMGVSFEAWLARDPTKQLDSKDAWDSKHGLELWWERNFYPDVQMIANDLHSKGLLEAGEYSIDIDW